MTVSRLLDPPAALASCVFVGIHRDTRGSYLVSEDRINYFPASPLAALTVVRHGRLMLLETPRLDPDASDLTPLSDVSVHAPSQAPVASWSPGDVEAVTVALWPDAWAPLGGPADFSAPPAGLAEAAHFLRDAPTVDAGWSAFCDALEAVWRGRVDPGWRPVGQISDWVRNVMAKAAQSSKGQSLRTFERRLKRLSGHTKQTLAFYTTFDELHRIAVTEPDAAPADIAAKAGFSDQSHMGRSVRRATGFSPAALNRAIQTREAFWCYRLLGQRY